MEANRPQRGAGRVETYVGAINLTTPHRAEDYPGILVARPGPGWDEGIICPQPGQTILALGGERAPGYTTPDGGVAREFALGPGDRATLDRDGLPHQMVEWRVERRP